MIEFTDTRAYRKPTRRQLDKQIDKQIEQLYAKHAAGRQINILKIGTVYADCRAAVAAGGDLEAAVIAAVAKYTEVSR